MKSTRTAANTKMVRVSDRAHALLRAFSTRTGKTQAEILEEALALAWEQEALAELRHAANDPPLALAAIYDALALRDPSIRAFYDTQEFGQVSARVYAALAAQPASGEVA